MGSSSLAYFGAAGGSHQTTCALCGPLRHQVQHLGAQHHLAVLVHRGVFQSHRAERARRGRLQLDHLGAGAQRVARPDRPRPAQIVHADAADIGLLDRPALPDQPEAQHQGVEAAGDEPAEHRVLGRRLGDVEGLRVPVPAEVEDLALAQRHRLALDDVAEGEILEMLRLPHRRASTMASPRSRVVTWPPRSGVFGPPPSSTVSIAWTMSAAAAACPRCSSIMAPDQIWTIGLAMPLPAMSGAEPCTGSKIKGCSPTGLMLADGAMLMEQATPGPTSDWISPNRLEPTTTQNPSG